MASLGSVDGEFPRRVGDMPAGTLLWAATSGYQAPARPTAHQAAPLGQPRPWAHLDLQVRHRDLAQPVQRLGTRALLSRDGRLVAHWADESDKPAHDQKIVQARSRDGVTWTGRRDTVTNPDFYVRPGMPGVRRLPDGTFLMVYEVCNLDEPLCSAYLRTSPDGWDYGDPLDVGTGVRTSDGKYPRHTPTITVTPGGRVLVASEMLVDDGAPAAGNGRTLLVNDRGGAGPWREIPAPVEVPDPNTSACRNFSPRSSPPTTAPSCTSPRTPSTGVCKAFHATGPIPPPA